MWALGLLMLGGKNFQTVLSEGAVHATPAAAMDVVMNLHYRPKPYNATSTSVVQTFSVTRKHQEAAFPKSDHRCLLVFLPCSA